MSAFPFRFKQERNPNFIGTREDFNKYLGGFCRNLVQKITKPYKASIGRCESCGITDRQLDAAHVHGKERKEIINRILNDYDHRGKLNVNLEEFEEKFITQHQPIEDVIKILCKDCHRKYDGQTDQNEKPKYQESNSMKITSYQSSRLLFKKSVIEPLQMDEKFSIHVTDGNETFTMSKAEFYQTFHNVAYSDSYSQRGSYSYSKTPDKAYKYLSTTKEQLNQGKSTQKEEKNFFEVLQEMPFSKDKVGESFIRQSETNTPIKIGRLIQEFFKENGGNLSPVVIQNLQSKEYSKRELGCNFPVLIPNSNSRIIQGYSRYYKDEYVPGYWLCSQWYSPSKEKFLKWKSSL